MACVFANGENEQGYPSKDIQFYVNADAGGGTDSICRKITQLAEKQLGGSFYLVNKPGVADAVGPSLIMAAKPDGYTIGNINYGSAVTAVYQKIVNDYSMDRLRFIALVTEECDAIMVSKRVPYRTFGAMEGIQSLGLLEKFPDVDRVYVHQLYAREVAKIPKLVVLDDDPTGIQTVHGMKAKCPWVRCWFITTR